MLGSVAIKPVHIFAIIYFIVLIPQKKTVKSIIKFNVILTIILLGYFNAIDKVEFWKSFVLTFLSITLIIFGPILIRKVSLEKKMQFFIFIFKSYVYVVIYGLLQFITKNFFGLDFLYNNLGAFQFHPHFENELFGLTRATSFFYEPSVFGWVTNLIISLLLVFKDRVGIANNIFYKYVIIYLIGLMVSLSSSAFSSLILILIIYFFIKSNRKAYFFLFSLPIIITIVWFIMPYLRITEIETENTSGYARLIFPFLNLEEVIKVYPYFGRGLGQFGVDDLSLVFDGIIHNSIFGFFISFGLSGLIIFIMALRRLRTYIILENISIIVWLNLILIFSTTGSFLSLELPFVYLIMYTLFSTINSDNYKRVEFKSI